MTGRRRKIIISIALAVVITAMAAGCGQPAPTQTQDEPEYANEISETLLQSLINTEDFNAFRGLYDEASQKNITEASFQQTHDQFLSAYGEYISKEFTGTRENVEDVYTEVSYKAVFGKRPDGITVKVLFQEAGDRVFASGIFFQES
jgi:hypothetical protein